MKFNKGKIQVKNSRGTWTKKENWATEDEVYEFIYGMVRAIKPNQCLESGTFKGDGTVAIAEALKENGKGHVTTVDEKDFRASERFADDEYVTFVYGSAPQVFDTIHVDEFDFVFLDSGHTYQQVSKELDAIHERVASNGYIIIHDVLHDHWGDGVMKAIKEFVDKVPGYSFIYLTNFNGLGILQKS